MVQNKCSSLFCTILIWIQHTLKILLPVKVYNAIS